MKVWRYVYWRHDLSSPFASFYYSKRKMKDCVPVCPLLKPADPVALNLINSTGLAIVESGAYCMQIVCLLVLKGQTDRQTTDLSSW